MNDELWGITTIAWLAWVDSLGIGDVVRVVVGTLIALAVAKWLKAESGAGWRRIKKVIKKKAETKATEEIERSERWRRFAKRGKVTEQEKEQCWEEVRQTTIGIGIAAIVLYVAAGWWWKERKVELVDEQIRIGMELERAIAIEKIYENELMVMAVPIGGWEKCDEMWHEIEQTRSEGMCAVEAVASVASEQEAVFRRCLRDEGWTPVTCKTEIEEGRCWEVMNNNMEWVGLRADPEVEAKECRGEVLNSVKVAERCAVQAEKASREENNNWRAIQWRRPNGLSVYRNCVRAEGYVSDKCMGEKCTEIRLREPECAKEIRKWGEQYVRPIVPECVARAIQRAKSEPYERQLWGDRLERHLESLLP